MITVQNILDYMEILAPAEYKMDWDNTGFHCGRRSKQVQKILLALDPFDHVCREAADTKADLLITHHPLLFHPAATVTDENNIGRALTLLIQNDISTFNAHTNYDCAPGGVNDVLAQTLGLSNITTVPTDPHNLLRQGTVREQPLDEFLSHIKTSLGAPGLRYVSSGNPVSRVAVGGGSCGGAMRQALEAGCDTFITADVGYNQFWDAQDVGMNLIDAGHFYTENPAMYALADKLRAAFPEIQVEISKIHTDCMKFYG